jgi:Uma2 family endonuclease
MSQTNTITTADQLLKAKDLGRCELVRGELILMSPAGSEHGYIARRLVQWLGCYVDQMRLGETYSSETGFYIERRPDTVRDPDASFVRVDRIPEQGSRGFFPGPPDYAFEVLSPDDSASEVGDKVDQWLTTGCQLVSVADPKKKTIISYTTERPVRIFRMSETYDAAPVLPGFKFAVDDLFRPPGPPR